MMIKKLPNRYLLFVLCIHTLLLLCAFQNVFAQEPAASVLEIRGRWLVNGGGRLSGGSVLGSGARVSIRAPERTDYIVITNLKGEIIARRYCSNAGACNGSIVIPSPPPCGFFCRVYETGVRLWYGEPQKFKNTASQGTEKGLLEAVVLLDKGKIDLKGVFKDLPDKGYRIRFVKPPCEDLSDCQTLFGPLNFEWSSQNPLPLAVRGLKPGLYEIQLLNPEDDEPEPGKEAWVLISIPGTFRKRSSTFEEIVSVTQKWSTNPETVEGENNKIKSSTVLNVRRAVLLNLSRVTPSPATKRSGVNKTSDSRKRKTR